MCMLDADPAVGVVYVHIARASLRVLLTQNEDDVRPRCGRGGDISDTDVCDEHEHDCREPNREHPARHVAKMSTVWML